ncbi:MAG: glycosyltransferase family 9 protein [Candidatus Acidiferrales bacterium]
MNPREPASLLPGLPPGAEILIIRLRSLGDVVLLTPALAAVHAWRPDLRLSVLVEPAWRAVLEGNPAVSEILIARGFAATALALRRKRFPIVFNQHGGPRSAFLTAATGAAARVCWKGKQFDFLHNVLAPDAVEFYGTPQVHTVEQRMTQFYWTGLPREPIPRTQVFPQADARKRVGEILTARGIAADEPFAVIQPGGRYFTKRWAIERFAELAGWLMKSRGIRPVVILGPGEREMAAAISERFASGSVVLESLDLRLLIALIAGARMFVGNDAGPAHLAAAAGTPAAIIFGSSSSVHWRPWHVEHRVVQNDFPCNPCKGDRCYAFDESKCILTISFEQVRDACEALLAGTDRGAPTDGRASVKIEGIRTN